MRNRALALTLLMVVGFPLTGSLTTGRDEASTVHAQAVDVEVDPITCWWRASTGFIRVGEPFSVTLTCAVVETQATRVVPDQSRLDPSVMQLPPFEVTGGTHGADVRTVGRRFLQYDYRVRLLAENLFGADATLAPLQVTYHVETRAGQGEATKGRDLTYQLPALSLRVSSLVPDATRDIREGPGVRLDDVDALRLRANALRLTAWVLGLVGALFAVSGLISLVRRRRGTSAARDTTVPARQVLGGVARSLQAVKHDSEQAGWSHEIAGRALAALRIAASYALDRPVAQQVTASGVPALEGHLLVSPGWPRPAAAAVSGAATTESIAKALNSAAPHRRQLTLEELRDALGGLTAARYGRNDTLDGAALDAALASGMRATVRLAADYTRVAEARRAMAGWAFAQTGRVWAR